MFEEGCQCLPEGGGDGKFGMVVEEVMIIETKDAIFGYISKTRHMGTEGV